MIYEYYTTDIFFFYFSSHDNFLYSQENTVTAEPIKKTIYIYSYIYNSNIYFVCDILYEASYESYFVCIYI